MKTGETRSACGKKHAGELKSKVSSGASRIARFFRYLGTGLVSNVAEIGYTYKYSEVQLPPRMLNIFRLSAA